MGLSSSAIFGFVSYNTISIYWQCINSVNQVFPKRGKGSSIAVTVRSLDPSLLTRLIPAYEVWREGQLLSNGLCHKYNAKTLYALLFKRNGIIRNPKKETEFCEAKTRFTASLLLYRRQEEFTRQ